MICQLSLFGQNQIDLANEYFDNREYEKALEIYERLAKRQENIPLIHKNYLEALKETNNPKEAEKYLKRLLKSDPYSPQFNADYAILLKDRGEATKSAEYLDGYLNSIKKDNQGLHAAALHFISVNLYEFAEKAYLLGQKNDRNSFQYELADLYSVWGKDDRMVNLYLEMLSEDEEQLEYIQGLLQDRLTDEEGFEKLEPILIEYVQKNPEKTVFGELLVWYYLQVTEYYKAFVQARAIDRKKKLEGFKILEIGKLALNNYAYKDAIRIFEYLVEKYAGKPVYSVSKRMLIKSKEELVKNTYPLDYEKIRSLASDYQQIISELGVNRATADAVRSYALLQAFYLDNKDSAVMILDELINTPNMQPSFISEAKLDLGDIYLLKNEPWEATLLYSQVEKAEKDHNTGHMAKLKNAKLSYYRGDFELARAHLDVLKLATSREIANDAMKISLLIQDNLDLDTTAFAMMSFASTELLTFQGKYDEALKQYDRMLRDYKGHNLSDEVLWEKSKILIKLGRFEEAEKTLVVILSDFSYDILADDANFALGRLYEENLGNPDKAMDYYKDQLTKFPGSIYVVEARKRFRRLRGDNLN
jgi:tetratricopeptide (TPR) repeat protein